MTSTRISRLISRMPAWFVEQEAALAALARRRQESLAEQAKLQFLFAVEIAESSWDVWDDTVSQLDRVQGVPS